MQNPLKKVRSYLQTSQVAGNKFKNQLIDTEYYAEMTPFATPKDR